MLAAEAKKRTFVANLEEDVLAAHQSGADPRLLHSALKLSQRVEMSQKLQIPF